MIAVPSLVKELPDRWLGRVAERRELSRTDPAADALEKAARELQEAITAAQDGARMVSTREFAELRGVRQATVRKWCAKGQIAGATKDGFDDWRIPASATRVRKRRPKVAT